MRLGTVLPLKELFCSASLPVTSSKGAACFTTFLSCTGRQHLKLPTITAPTNAASGTGFQAAGLISS